MQSASSGNTNAAAEAIAQGAASGSAGASAQAQVGKRTPATAAVVHCHTGLGVRSSSALHVHTMSPCQHTYFNAVPLRPLVKLQAIAQGLSSGGGTAQAVAQAAAQAYTKQPDKVTQALASALTQVPTFSVIPCLPCCFVSLLTPAGTVRLDPSLKDALLSLATTHNPRPLLTPVAPAQANSNPSGASAAAGAVAQALTSGGSQANAFAKALASAASSGGCGAISNVLAREQATAFAAFALLMRGVCYLYKNAARLFVHRACGNSRLLLS